MARIKVALVLSAAASLGALTGSMDGRSAVALEAKLAAPQPARQAPQLVEQALAKGLAGDESKRVELLKQAAEADPAYAPAKWQRGLVNFDGEWRTPAEVGSIVSADKRWQEYETLRNEARDTLADHLRLAQWSMRQGLTAEERYHWANVLMANPLHEQARQRLGAQEYRGRLYTREQVAAEKARLEQAERDLAKFKPEVAHWCKQATSELKVTRDKGLAKIRALDEVAAIPALSGAVRRAIETPAGKRHREELILAMTAALGNMPDYFATCSLLELSVYSSLPSVRQAAAEALRSRPATDYVPLLMASLQAPIETDVDLMAAPDGTVRMIETTYQQEPLRQAAQVRTTNFEVVGALGRDQAKTDVAGVINGNLRSAAGRVASTQDRVAAENAAINDRNQRVQAVLKITLGQEVEHKDATAWWEGWKNYNELSYDSSQVVYDSVVNNTFTQIYEQAPRGVMTPVGEGGDRLGVAAALQEMHECFAAGTPVWTQSGPKPIERIRIGDLVLAQQPTTGELAYRPVIDTSVTPDAPTVRVKLPQEEFYATRGHRFWVNGDGWRMAKELPKVGRLHALTGGQPLESVEAGEAMDCYNLVVEDFHTFVVGKSQLLVHDKNCPQPTLAKTPGFIPPRPKVEPVRQETELLSASER